MQYYHNPAFICKNYTNFISSIDTRAAPHITSRVSTRHMDSQTDITAATNRIA